MRVAKHGESGADHAVTLYALADQAGQKARFLVMRPITGRTHQLRAHAAHIGHPIFGDPKYFDIENWELPGGLQNRLHLLARRIVVPHPKGGVIDVSAPLPQHMQQTLCRARLRRAERRRGGGEALTDEDRSRSSRHRRARGPLRVMGTFVRGDQGHAFGHAAGISAWGALGACRAPCLSLVPRTPQTACSNGTGRSGRGLSRGCSSRLNFLRSLSGCSGPRRLAPSSSSICRPSWWLSAGTFF